MRCRARSGYKQGYAPHNTTPERNHWLDTGTGSLLPHEAPRFGRLRLPQLGAGVSRNGSVKRPDARRGGIILRSLQPGHLTLVGIRTSGPYRVCASGRGSARLNWINRRQGLPDPAFIVDCPTQVGIVHVLYNAVKSNPMRHPNSERCDPPKASDSNTV